MKLFIALAALVLSAQALPTNFGKADNATFSAGERNIIGFGSFGGGTFGGSGGATWTVWDAWALRDAISGNAARIVYVRGQIDLTALFTSSPGVVLDVGSHKTIIGGDNNAAIIGGGLRIKRGVQVIIQKLKMFNALSFAPNERPNGSGGISNMQNKEFTEVDAILIEESQYVWVDHNEFADDPWIAATSPKESLRHDGLLDIKRASNYVTISYNIFRNHNKVMLIGHSDSNGSQDNGKLKTTIVYNWFQGTIQRNPRVRFGEVHVLHNLYTDMRSYGIGVGQGASIYAERNVFINSVTWRYPDGSVTTGDLLNVSNQLQGSSKIDSVTNNVKWNPSNYYKYSAKAVGTVEAYVRANAGVR